MVSPMKAKFMLSLWVDRLPQRLFQCICLGSPLARSKLNLIRFAQEACSACSVWFEVLHFHCKRSGTKTRRGLLDTAVVCHGKTIRWNQEVTEQALSLTSSEEDSIDRRIFVDSFDSLAVGKIIDLQKGSRLGHRSESPQLGKIRSFSDECFWALNWI